MISIWYSVVFRRFFLKNLSELFVNSLCVKIYNSLNTLQFFHIPPNYMSRILIMEKTYILHLLTFFFFVILFLICLTEFESTKLKCYITTWLCAIDVNTLFLEFSPKKCFSLLTIPSITLNQLFYIGQFKSVSIN